MSIKPDDLPMDQILSTDIEHIIPSRYSTTGDIRDINTFTAKDVAEHMTRWLAHIISQKEIAIRVITAPELRVLNEAMVRTNSVIDKGVIVSKDSLEPLMPVKVSEQEKTLEHISPSTEVSKEETLLQLALVEAYRHGLSEAKQVAWGAYKKNGHPTHMRELHDDIMALVGKSEKEIGRIKTGELNPLASPSRHWMHVKSGGGYRELLRGTLQCSDEKLDMQPVVVYTGMDGRVWVRPTFEFDDGRFKIATPSKGWYAKMIEKINGVMKAAGSQNDVQG